jgi:hypothetical protein
MNQPAPENQVDELIKWKGYELHFGSVKKAVALGNVIARMQIRKCWFLKIDYGRVMYDAITPKTPT